MAFKKIEGEEVDLTDFIGPDGKPKKQRRRFGLEFPQLRMNQLLENEDRKANDVIPDPPPLSGKQKKGRDIGLDHADRVEDSLSR
jgi:hypothetical protein